MFPRNKEINVNGYLRRIIITNYHYREVDVRTLLFRVAMEKEGESREFFRKFWSSRPSVRIEEKRANLCGKLSMRGAKKRSFVMDCRTRLRNESRRTKWLASARILDTGWKGCFRGRLIERKILRILDERSTFTVYKLSARGKNDRGIFYEY